MIVENSRSWHIRPVDDLKNDRIILFTANRCKELRASKKLTQLDVLNDTGIAIGRIEQGGGDVNITTIQKLADYFEISVMEFFANHK